MPRPLCLRPNRARRWLQRFLALRLLRRLLRPSLLFRRSAKLRLRQARPRPPNP